MTDTPAEALPLRDEIFQRMDELTPAERKVARTLLARYPAAGLESTAALAAAAGTSKPTVLRLLDRLGFGSYPEFQERLRGEVTRSMNESPLSRARARREMPSDDSVFLRAVERRARLVTRLPDTVPPAEIERAVSLLAGRPKPVVICGVVAYDIAARIRYAGAGLATAVRETIETELGKRGSTGGVIAVGGDGRIVVAHNSPAMFSARGAGPEPTLTT